MTEDIEYVMCPSCKGWKQVVATPRPLGADYVAIDCPNCYGTGKVIKPKEPDST